MLQPATASTRSNVLKCRFINLSAVCYYRYAPHEFDVQCDNRGFAIRLSYEDVNKAKRMNHRIHGALDGDLRAEALTSKEAADYRESRDLFDRVVKTIPSDSLPLLGASVLQRIEGNEKRGPLGWLWSPIAVRPVYVLALAASLLVVFGLASRTTRPLEVPRKVLVHFQLDAPQARAVSLAGDFSNWAPTYVMTRSEPGVWTIVVPLAPGVHDYSFIVDGEKWIPDPAAPARDDGFGGKNSRVAVLSPDERRSL